MSRASLRSVCFPGLALLAALVAAGALACSPSLEVNPDESSGGDGERGRAVRMPLDEPVLDDVNYTEGDMHDWKYFQIPGPGRITVRLGCDNSGAACIANVRDDVGVVLRRLAGGEGPVTETLGVSRGNYYIEVYAQASSTSYTVLVEYEPN